MSKSSSNADEIVECPLCMEPLEVDDLNFFPCTCGYQICRFCWHRIRTDENELCPACRKEYPENPADFKPLSQEEMIAFKFQKRQRDQQRKQKVSENRKHLANVRVVQKNLVFVVGLSPRLADAEVLRKHEYFGKYGKIHKVVINPSTTYAGVQGPSASAYVTYILNSDALRAIQSVNNIMIDGRLIKTSLGTTKYCSHFMKNQQCPKSDCMYLHELGDPEASFTKEEMHQGKHQDYEKRLHELLNATTNIAGSHASISDVCSSIPNTGSKKFVGTDSLSTNSGNKAAENLPSLTAVGRQKDAWPSLSLSPLCQKDQTSSDVTKRIKERFKQDKSKNEKLSKHKNKDSVSHHNDNILAESLKDGDNNTDGEKSILSDYALEKPEVNNCKDKLLTACFSIKQEDAFASPLNKTGVLDVPTKLDRTEIISPLCGSISSNTEHNDLVADPINKQISFNVYKNCTFEDAALLTDNVAEFEKNNKINEDENCISQGPAKIFSKMTFNIHRKDGLDITNSESDEITDAPTYCLRRTLNNTSFENLANDPQLATMKESKDIGDGKVKNQICGRNVPLPDLINGIEGYQNNATITPGRDWENAFNNVVLKTCNQVDNAFQQQHMQHQLEEIPQLRHQNDSQRFQDIQLRSTFLMNSTSPLQTNLSRNGLEFSSNFYCGDHQPDTLKQHNPIERTMQNGLSETNMSKFFDFHKNQQQKMQMQNFNNSAGSVCGGVSENFHMMSLVEGKLQSQQVDLNSSPSSSQSQHFSNQKYCGKADHMILYHQIPPKQSNSSVSSMHHEQFQKQCTAHSCADDDLGFDPFVETQKALAELIENEEEQYNGRTTAQSKHATHMQLNQQQGLDDQPVDTVRGLRTSQMGLNNFGAYNNSHPMQTNSKILPFVNLSSNNKDIRIHPGLQQQPNNNVWGSNMNNVQQYSCVPPVRSEPFHQRVCNQRGFTGGDWTTMDPAILSFRQFSFPQHNQMGIQLQQPEHEVYMQQLTQHQAGFGQTQQGGRNNILNPVGNMQHNSQAQVAANVQGMLEYLKNRQCI